MPKIAWFVLVVLGGLAVAERAGAAVSFRVVSSAAVSAEGIAHDVRWAGPSEVYVALGKSGVVRMRVDAAAPFTQVMPAANRGGFFLSSQVAVGQKHLVVGSPFGGYGWISLDSRLAKVEERALIAMMDIDARGDVVTVLGADSGDQQGLAQDGAIAWTGSLSENLKDLRPLMKGRSKPGGKDMARCAFLETGAIRFMLDGTLILMPGVEPGVYRYDADGKLLQTWDTGSFGVIDDCDMDEAERATLGRDFARRLDWLASRVVVDDIIPLRNGPALLLRRVEKGVTKWDVVTLPYRGKPERTSLPVSLPTARGHLRGDVRGDQLALLVFDEPLPGQKAAEPPRLFVLAISGQ